VKFRSHSNLMHGLHYDTRQVWKGRFLTLKCKSQHGTTPPYLIHEIHRSAPLHPWTSWRYISGFTNLLTRPTSSSIVVFITVSRPSNLQLNYQSSVICDRCSSSLKRWPQHNTSVSSLKVFKNRIMTRILPSRFLDVILHCF